MQKDFSALLVAAPRSGEGKTSVTGALARGFRSLSLNVACFKCGPDFIDPAFLKAASGRPCLNLDTWIMGEDGTKETFARHCAQADVALVEGVMGLLDGKGGKDGEGSSLDCARTLGIPMLLAVNAKGMAASITAIVEGCTLAARRKGVDVIGVVATKTGSATHQKMLADALSKAKLPPLLGVLRTNGTLDVPSRKLGLVPLAELGEQAESSYLQALETAALEDIDLEGILRKSRNPRPTPRQDQAPKAPARPPKRLALASDQAFCLSYPENLDWISRQGWMPIPFSPLKDKEVPDADAILLGNGYPETFAEELSRNASMRSDIKAKAEAGLPVYAEGGGFIYLAESLEKGMQSYPMCGVIRAKALAEGKRAMGYREAKLLRPLPFGATAQTLRGHEFHWSTIKLLQAYPPLTLVLKKNGQQEEEGVVAGPAENVLATSLHLFWKTDADKPQKPDAAGEGATSPASPDETEQAPLPSSPQKGVVILVSGPSSSGKSTLTKELEGLLKEQFPQVARLSLDGFLRSVSTGGNPVSTLKDAETLGLKVAETYHLQIAAIANSGRVLVCDHVLQDNPSWLTDIEGRLDKALLFQINLSCDEKTLKEREEQRTDRKGNIDHAMTQAKRNLSAPRRGLLLDSSLLSPRELAMQAMKALARMPLSPLR